MAIKIDEKAVLQRIDELAREEMHMRPRNGVPLFVDHKEELRMSPAESPFSRAAHGEPLQYPSLDVPMPSVKPPKPSVRVFTFSSNFAPGDVVHIDDDKSICGRVTGHWWRNTFLQIEVSWFCNGDAKVGWFDENRLKLVAD